LLQVDELSETSYGSAGPSNMYEHSGVAATTAATQLRPRHWCVIVHCSFRCSWL